MNILKLEPGDIIVHELFGDLTILHRDIENERYLVIVEAFEITEPQWISFKEVEEVCEIKK